MYELTHKGMESTELMDALLAAMKPAIQIDELDAGSAAAQAVAVSHGGAVDEEECERILEDFLRLRAHIGLWCLVLEGMVKPVWLDGRVHFASTPKGEAYLAAQE